MDIEPDGATGTRFQGVLALNWNAPRNELQMLSMRSLLCMSRGNHYILYFTAREYLKSRHFKETAVENLPAGPRAWRWAIRTAWKEAKPSPEPMP